MNILLINYDNGQHVQYFPIGLAYLAGALSRVGHDVNIWNQAIHHSPEERITRYIDLVGFDVVGLGFVGNYYTFQKAKRISQAVRKTLKRVHYILGGHGPSADPEFFMKEMEADAVVVGEGERAVHDAIHKSGVFKSPLIKDIDSIPRPVYEKFPINVYRLKREPHCRPTDFVMPIISARGCVYKCNFCYRMDRGYRVRSVPSVIAEIEYLKATYGITYIDFADELTFFDEKRGRTLCEALLPLKIRWMCNGRLNLVDNKLLKLMKRAGCVFVNYGIEAMDDGILKRMNKKLTVEQVYKGIEATLAAGISPGFNIIFGHIGDTKESLEKGVEFILKYDDGAQRRTMLPVTPYPGSELFREAIRRGLLKDTEDFYKKHTNSDLLTVNFTDLSDDEFHMALFDANKRLLENHYRLQLNAAVKDAEEIYMKHNTSFRGFRA